MKSKVLSKDLNIKDDDTQHVYDSHFLDIEDYCETKKLWTPEIYEYISFLKNEATKKTDTHAIAGHYFRNLEIVWGLPSIIVPIVFSPIVILTSVITDEKCVNSINISDYISTFGLVLTGVLTSVCGFFKYGNRSIQHHLFSAKYNDIITDLDVEIVKHDSFRTNADLFVTTMKMKYDNLVFGEPVVPKSIESNYSKSL